MAAQHDLDGFVDDFARRLNTGPPALQVNEPYDPQGLTVNRSVELKEEDALSALILNLDASARLEQQVTIAHVNGFSGQATVVITKRDFVESRLNDHKPDFVGISEVKNQREDGEAGILGLLGNRDGPFGYLSRKFFGNDSRTFEYLIHGWDTSKYIIDGSNGPVENRIDSTMPPGLESPWGYGHRYIWTRLVSKTDSTKTFILVTCHMPTQRIQRIKVPDAWRGLMKFIETQNKNGVPILLMGDTNRSWKPPRRVPRQGNIYNTVTLQDVLGENPENPYPHLALDVASIQGDIADFATTENSHIDNFIFFYKDGKEHNDDFQKKYRVHYHRLGWTTHHVLVFKFNKSLLEY